MRLLRRDSLPAPAAPLPQPPAPLQLRKAEAVVDNDAVWQGPGADKRARMRAITYNNLGCLFKRRNMPQLALQASGRGGRRAYRSLGGLAAALLCFTCIQPCST